MDQSTLKLVDNTFKNKITAPGVKHELDCWIRSRSGMSRIASSEGVCKSMNAESNERSWIDLLARASDVWEQRQIEAPKAWNNAEGRLKTMQMESLGQYVLKA